MKSFIIIAVVAAVAQEVTGSLPTIPVSVIAELAQVPALSIPGHGIAILEQGRSVTYYTNSSDPYTIGNPLWSDLLPASQIIDDRDVNGALYVCNSKALAWADDTTSILHGDCQGVAMSDAIVYFLVNNFTRLYAYDRTSPGGTQLGAYRAITGYTGLWQAGTLQVTTDDSWLLLATDSSTVSVAALGDTMGALTNITLPLLEDHTLYGSGLIVPGTACYLATGRILCYDLDQLVSE